MYNRKNWKRDEEAAVFASGKTIPVAAAMPKEINQLEHDFSRNEHRRRP
jgi:hypothetical protein